DISAQTGAGGHNSLIAAFGLYDATMIDSLIIEWPSGIRQELANVNADQFLVITEEGTPTGVADKEIGLPDSYLLHQNFPNPFNPQTTIKYQLKHTSDVRLEIYNLLGQRVITLVDEQQPAGFYAVQWSGQDALYREIASGVYLYRLQAGEFTSVRKLTLLR
ncbi:MAG: T9SS type A sorting domain-containing protein, partial [bacterium]